MIVLDTHIWFWWIQDRARLTPKQRETIAANETDVIGISAISCWEIAKLVQYGTLTLPLPLNEWFERALGYPGMQLLELTPEIAVESTQLPEPIHRDPSDQIIIATARVHDCLLITTDAKILSYPYVKALV